MKKIILLIFYFVVLSSCRTPQKTITTSDNQEQIETKNNISFVQTEQLNTAVSKAIEGYFNENLKINIYTKKFDTDKPVNEFTNKPPLKEETNISINKTSDSSSKQLTDISTHKITSALLTDKSIIKQQSKSLQKVEQETGYSLFQKIMILVFICLLVVCISLFVFRK